jgi:hypothetical protein
MLVSPVSRFQYVEANRAEVFGVGGSDQRQDQLDRRQVGRYTNDLLNNGISIARSWSALQYAQAGLQMRLQRSRRGKANNILHAPSGQSRFRLAFDASSRNVGKM